MFDFIPGHICERCGKSYNSKASLYKHQIYCGISPHYACGVENCAYKTNIKQNLRKHITRVHKMIIITLDNMDV